MMPFELESAMARIETLTGRRRRRGLTLIEAALVLGIITMIFGGLASILGETMENQRSKNVADRMRELLTASEKYVNARLSAIRLNGPGYAAYVPVAGIGQPGMPGLIEGGYLPSTYADYDAYNQRHALLVRVLPPATGSTMNRVEALVTTIPNGKTVIPLRMRGRIARMIGAQGGFCASAGAGAAGVEGCSVITGTGGGWRAAASDWSIAGIAIQNGSVQAVVNSGDNAVLSDYLNRNNVGDPAANTMNTTIYSNAPAGNYALQADPTTGQTTLQIGPNINVPGTAKIGACGDQPNQAGDLVACNNVVASQFVDRDNPNYKVDPDKTSHLKQMDITDTVVSTTDGGDRLNGTNLRLRDLLPRYVAQDGFIVQAGMDGKQPTFALLDDWVPHSRDLSGEEALAVAVERYVRSHGPVHEKDVAGWWGGTLRDVRAAIAALGDRLTTVEHDGVSLLVHAEAEPPASPVTVLLPAFDEYLLGYKDRSPVLAPEHASVVVPGKNGVFSPTVLVDGEVVGLWRRRERVARVEVTINPFDRLPKRVLAGIEAAAAAYASFTGLELDLEVAEGLLGVVQTGLADVVGVVEGPRVDRARGLGGERAALAVARAVRRAVVIRAAAGREEQEGRDHPCRDERRVSLLHVVPFLTVEGGRRGSW